MNVLALTLASLVVAQTTPQAVPAPAPDATPTTDALAYDDPGMHFRPPDGWARVVIPPAGSDDAGKRPVAAYVFHGGRSDQRTILIQVEPFDGTLDGLESSRESDLRSQTEGTFVDHKKKTALANGMPAYFLTVSQPSGPAGNQVRRYEYVVFDLHRSIEVSYVGRYGDFSEDDAKAALASLYVVVYPGSRR